MFLFYKHGKTKSYVLKKKTKRRNYTQGTGGGPPIKISFSNFEEEVLNFLTPEAARLEGIPEGGINIEENILNKTERKKQITAN